MDSPMKAPCVHHYIIDSELLGKCRKCNAKKQFPIVSWDTVNPWRDYEYYPKDRDTNSPQSA